MQAPPDMRTAPARGRRADTKSGVVGGTTKPDLATGAACVNNLRDLRRLTARLAFLADWKENIERRIADVDARLWEPNWFFSRVYQDEVDDLTDAIAAWRLAAAGVVLELADVGDVRRPA